MSVLKKIKDESGERSVCVFPQTSKNEAGNRVGGLAPSRTATMQATRLALRVVKPSAKRHTYRLRSDWRPSNSPVGRVVRSLLSSDLSHGAKTPETGARLVQCAPRVF